MKKLLIVLAAMAPLATTAMAELIDFEDIQMSTVYGGSRDEFNNLGIANTYRGYTWTTGASSFGTGVWGVVDNTDGTFASVGAHGGKQSGWTFNGPLEMTVTFNADKNVNSAWFNVFSGGQDWGADAIRMRGYDASNNLVGDTGDIALDDVSANPAWVQVNAGFTGVRTLVMTGRQDDPGWTGAGWWAVDDIELSPVPEPCTMLALGAGLAAFVAKRRKK